MPLACLTGPKTRKNPGKQAKRARATLDMIEDVKIIDEHSVEFVFNKSLFTNLAYTLDGPRVMVWPKDEQRARQTLIS